MKAVAALLGAVAIGLGWSGDKPSSKGPPPCREAALVSLRTGTLLRRFTAAGSEFAHGYRTGPLIPGGGAVSDGRGGWFVAGLGIARMRRDGSLDPSWHSSVRRKRQLASLVRVGSTLYTDDGYRVFAVSARNGRLLWTSERASRREEVGILALAATPTAVYIAGYLDHVGQAHRRRVAALDARTGRLLAWHVPRLGYFQGSSPVVSGLAVGPTRLYLVGGFTGVGGAPRKDGLAAVRLADGALTGFSPSASLWNVEALVVHGSNVLIGGPEGGGVFDAASGAFRASMDPLPRAGSITVKGHTAYLGGDVRTTIGGHNLLALDLRTGRLRNWFPKLAKYVSAGVSAFSGDRAFVGGQFCSTLG